MWMTTEVTGLHRARSRYGWIAGGLCLHRYVYVGLRLGCCRCKGGSKGECGRGGGALANNTGNDGDAEVRVVDAEADDRASDTGNERTLDSNVDEDDPEAVATRACLLNKTSVVAAAAETEAPNKGVRHGQGHKFLPM